jgi:uncharacterized OB-fold protein|tara:strand:+ start:199 stop:1131 length:933 start_codon:yes stop_codon:yes gene_type:complete
MLAMPDTWTQDLGTFPSDLKMPYTLTPGRAAGSVLAEAKNKRLVGSRFPGGTVTVPAQDFCPLSGDSDPELVEAPSTGMLTGFTQTAAGIIGTIQIDGSDTDMVHKIIGVDLNDLEIGARVEADWSDEDGAEGILAIKGFSPVLEALMGQLRPLEKPADFVEVVKYELALHYEHAFGPYYGRMFDEIKTNKRIMGIRTSDASGALLPPREIDDITHRKTGTWVEVGQTGTVKAMSVIHLEFVGQTQKPPYIYAEIILDGALTRLIHIVLIDDMDRAKDVVTPGTRVRAVWRDAEPTGSMSDISHFEVIED